MCTVCTSVVVAAAAAVVMPVSTFSFYFFFDVLELPILLEAELAERETLLTGLVAAVFAALTNSGRPSRPVAPCRGCVIHCDCLGGLCSPFVR